MKSHEKGIVLILTLWIIVVLASVSLAYVRQAMFEAKMVAFQRDAAIVDTVAKAGIRQALILLREDRIKDSGEEVQETITHFGEDDIYLYDGGTEDWATRTDLYIDVPFYEVGDKAAYYYVTVEDESAKFPLANMSTTPEMIQHLLELSGVQERDAMQLAAAIIDWRDADDLPTVLGGMGGGSVGEDEYSTYNSGRGRGRRGRRGRDDIPEVQIKNSPIDSIDELLLIPGMTPEIVFGTVDPDEMGSGRFRRRRTGRGEYLGLINLVSVYASKVNMNTVKQDVLESLLYQTMGEDAEKLAQDWVEYRDGRDRQTYTDDDKVMKTLDNSDMDDVHYTEVDGFTDEVWKSLQNFAGITSELYVVTSMAEYEGIEKGFRAVVERHFTPWEAMPIFGIDTMQLEDLEQVVLQIRLFEPIYDVNTRIDNLS